jgi:mono/diheme cytochrome c family protein
LAQFDNEEELAMTLGRRLIGMLALILAGPASAASTDLPETSGGSADLPATAAESDNLPRGRYLVTIAGCNDCHTAGWMQSGGQVPEKDWLTGEGIGWRGAWGTTYAVNLRLYLNGLTEDQWVERARTVRTRPPMPWWALHAMTDSDLRAIYQYVKSLGPGGRAAPSYVPPGQEPKTPFVLMEPQGPMTLR